MKNFITLLVVFSFCSIFSLQAAEFENGVPVELIEQFANGQISEGLPSNFPDFDQPDSVSILGSLDANYMQTVVFNSSVDTDDAVMELAGSLMDAGWIRLVSPTYEQPTYGFISPNQPALPFGPDDQLCHDRFGTMTLSKQQGNDSIVSLRLSNQPMMQPGFSCRQQNQQRQMQSDRMVNRFPLASYFQEYIPTLILPEEENVSPISRNPFFGIGGFSGSSDDMETRGSYSGDMNAEELNIHFAAQLEEQGWTLDSDWSGEVSSGGNWRLSPQQDMNLLGILTILERTENVFELKFRMLTMGGNTSNARRIDFIGQ